MARGELHVADVAGSCVLHCAFHSVLVFTGALEEADEHTFFLPSGNSVYHLVARVTLGLGAGSWKPLIPESVRVMVLLSWAFLTLELLQS